MITILMWYSFLEEVQFYSHRTWRRSNPLPLTMFKNFDKVFLQLLRTDSPKNLNFELACTEHIKLKKNPTRDGHDASDYQDLSWQK